MAKKKQQPIEPEEEPDDLEMSEKLDEEEEPEVKEFMEIGGSPVPGITLRQVLRGHEGDIRRIAWSPDGRYLASPSNDKSIRIWDVGLGECVKILQGHNSPVVSVAWSPDGNQLASGSGTSEVGSDNTVRIWDTSTGKQLWALSHGKDIVYGKIAWSPDSRVIVTGGYNGNLRIWNVKNGNLVKLIENAHTSTIYTIEWAPNKNIVVSGGNDEKIHLWNTIDWSVEKSLALPKKGVVMSIVWINDDELIFCGDSKTLQIWNVTNSQLINTVEGHTNYIQSISLSADGKLLASKSSDKTVKIWPIDNWERSITFYESTHGLYSNSLALHPKLPRLATLGKNDTVIHIWDIDYDALIGGKPTADSIRYTTAKLVLVGDSGVGKTGLGWRLAHNEFKEHSSTHGQQFWAVPELGYKRKDGTECEAVLWDLAGQPDYRLVHSLYLDDVDTALVLFDPTNRQEPLAGVDFWLNQLKDKDKKLRNSILVGARTDRGTSTLTDTEIQAFCRRNGVIGGYIATSAKEGKGLPELMKTLKAQIPWDTLPATITTATFKQVKEYVLELKEKPRRKKILLQPADLRKQLEKLDKKWTFTNSQMMTAVGHLEDHGYVKVLHGSNGEENVLLSPDILANLASSIVLEARRSPRGLGVLEEARLLRGEYQFPELIKINESESKILLDAATVLFLEHNLCFRENFNQQIFLVFPSLINEKRPIDEGANLIEGETYQVKGAVENLYASMVVLLGYTNTFVRTHQWQSHAQYEMGKGEVCGFQQINYDDGNIELVLNYGEQTPDPVRLMFRGLFERFLSRRELEIARYQTVTCKGCGTVLARNVVLDQINKNKKFTYCHECGKRVTLPSPEPLTRLSPKQEVEIDTQQTIANYRTAFEAALVRVKGLLRDKKRKKKPSCFISYAWGVSENERWVLQFAKDLRNADIDVLLDRWDSPLGSNLDLYIERILSSDFVIPVGTPELRKKYDARKVDRVVSAELKLINLRVRQPSEYGNTVLPVLLTGTAKKSLTPQLQPLVSVDFRESELYFRKLFDLIWHMYNLPSDNPLLEELQESMLPQKR